MQISLTKLNQLVAVAEAGSFSKAAAHLNLSQPALSRSIAALEARYGIKIFNRAGRGVVLTSSGHQIIAQARGLLQTMRVFDKNLYLYGTGEAGELSIGFGPLLASRLLPGLVSQLFGVSPQIRVQSLIRPGPLLVQALQADAIEIFFCPNTQIAASPELEMTEVGRLEPKFLVRRQHPLAGKTNVTRSDISQFSYANAVDVHDLGSGGVSPPAFICDNFSILRDAVLQNDFVWLCSRDFVASDLAQGDLIEISVEDYEVESSAIVAAKLAGRSPSPLAERAFDYISAELSQAH